MPKFTEEEYARARQANREHELEQEIESLRTQVAAAEFEVDKMHNLRPGEGIMQQARHWKAEAEILSEDAKSLRDRVTEMEADKARLDWVVANDAEIWQSVDGWHVSSGVSAVLAIFTMPTLRKAIDAAMAADEREKETHERTRSVPLPSPRRFSLRRRHDARGPRPRDGDLAEQHRASSVRH